MSNQFVSKDAFKVIGRFGCIDDNIWGKCKADSNFFGTLNSIEENPYILGLCFGNDKDGRNKILVGIETEHESVGEFDSYICPKSDWLMFIAEGKISDNTLGRSWVQIYEDALPKSGCIQRDIPTVETYVEWDEQKDFCIVEIAIPIE